MPHGLSIKQLEMLEAHMYILKKLTKVSPQERKAILQKAPPQLFRALNLVFKLLSDRNLPKKHAHKIKKHNRFLQSTRDLKPSAINRKLQTQHGGFLPALIGAAIPVIGDLLGRLF